MIYASDAQMPLQNLGTYSKENVLKIPQEEEDLLLNGGSSWVLTSLSPILVCKIISEVFSCREIRLYSPVEFQIVIILTHCEAKAKKPGSPIKILHRNIPCEQSIKNGPSVREVRTSVLKCFERNAGSLHE